MIEHFVSKSSQIGKQPLTTEAKIAAKIAHLRSISSKQHQSQLEYEEQSDSLQRQSHNRGHIINSVGENDEMRQAYRCATIGLISYMDKMKNSDGDTQYVHKLLFDFFRVQSQYENLQEDNDNLHIYARFTPPDDQSPKSNDSPKQNVPIKREQEQRINIHQQTQKKMTLQQKLMAGKFCSFDHIPQYGQIQDYKSISSEQQIFDHDCLEDLMTKMKKKEFPYNKQSQDKKIKNKSRKRQDIKRYYVDRPKIQPRRNFDALHQRRLARGYYDQEEQIVEKPQSVKEQGLLSGQQSNSSDDERLKAQIRQTLVMEDYKNMDTFEEEVIVLNEIDEVTNKKKEKKVNGVQEYHSLSRHQKPKYFKKMTKEYQNNLKRAKQRKRQQKPEKVQKIKKKGKNVSFNDSIFYKVFKAEEKPTQIRIADEKKEVLVKAIWQYDDQD